MSGNEIKSIEMDPIETDGLILDIGGGGEGIIGKLNGKQVIAVDTSERELQETVSESLKVVMDATDLKFLPKSFDVCTAFFSLMYIPKNKHLEVFKEVHRVLKDNGRFLLWDARTREEQGVQVFYGIFESQATKSIDRDWIRSEMANRRH